MRIRGNGQRLGMETLNFHQKRQPMGGQGVCFTSEAEEFRKLLRKSRLKFATSHDSYLINLASPDAALWRKSVEAFIDELIRAGGDLAYESLVTHPGAHVTALARRPASRESPVRSTNRTRTVRISAASFPRVDGRSGEAASAARSSILPRSSRESRIASESACASIRATSLLPAIPYRQRPNTRKQCANSTASLGSIA